MDIELVLDCQTKNVYSNCEYCIANKTCLIQESLEKDETAEEIFAGPTRIPT